MSAATPPPLRLGMEVGGFLLEECLGAGGFGTVYRATRGGRDHALKLLKLERVGDWARREVDILNRLRHPHVVAFLGCGYYPDERPEYLYIVMEYVRGRQLDRWTAEENPTARQAARVVLALARALEAVHAAGVVHRDLKESNVLVEDGGRVKLIDLGVGVYAGAVPVTPLGLPPGTPDYLPPEAWRYRRNLGRVSAPYAATPSHDVWALGILLFRLLTDARPFDTSRKEGVEALLEGAARPPQALNARVPPALGALCLRMLAKELKSRLASASAVCAALEELLGDADPAWDVPLCEAYAPDNLTTGRAAGPANNAEAVRLWVNRARHPPRRGLRPAQDAAGLPGGAGPEAAAVADGDAGAAGAEAAPPPAGVPTVRARPASSDADPRTRSWRAKPRVGRGWGAGLLLGLGVLAGGLLVAGARLWAPGGEVARPENRPDAGAAAAPFLAEATPAAVALPATPAEERTAMKPTDTASLPPPKPLAPRAGAVTKAVGTATACLALACGGGAAPQVRPAPMARSAPGSAPCPRGAVKAMADLDIDVGSFIVDGALGVGSRTTVREGWRTVRLEYEEFGDLPKGTVLSGRILLGDRVRGRFTEATPPGGRPVPVCLEMRDADGNPGLEIWDGTPSAPVVRNVPYLWAVERFE